MKRLFTATLLAVCLVAAPDSRSCSTFTLQKKGQVVYGRNLDWFTASGLICINPRKVAKKALILQMKPREAKPLEWTSELGSVTFNSLGKEFPTGGMNEAGLVVDVMWLDQTQYPKADSRPEIGVLQWTQYLLDTCRTVEEALATASKVRISEDGFPPQHYLICDRKGNTAVVEFIQGKMSVCKGAELPYTALANSTYEESAKSAARCFGLGGREAIPQGQDSLDRFARVAYQVKAFSGPARKMVDYSFSVLHSVNAGYDPKQHSTCWSIVYDMTGKKVYFKTNSNRKVRSINFASMDFSNQKPPLVWSIEDDSEGDISRQGVPYTKAVNREVIVRQITNPGVVSIFGDVTRMIDAVADYPETCKAVAN